MTQYPDITKQAGTFSNGLAAIRKTGGTITLPKNPTETDLDLALNKWYEGYDTHKDEDTSRVMNNVVFDSIASTYQEIVNDYEGHGW